MSHPYRIPHAYSSKVPALNASNSTSGDCGGRRNLDPVPYPWEAHAREGGTAPEKRAVHFLFSDASTVLGSRIER